MMIDVLLINPGDQREVYQSLAINLTAKEPPIWCRLIASYLRAKSLSVDILDAEVYDISPATVAHVAKMMRARLIVVVVHGHQPSASTQKMPAATATIKAIKEELPASPVLVVGAHPAALPWLTLIETGADFVCLGEGPVTVYELACNLKVGRPFNSARGLAWLDSGELCASSIAPNVADLSGEMPGGCWDLLPMRGYRSYAHHAWSNDFKRQPYASIYTSLGCPYACGFCMIQAPFSLGDQLVLKGRANSYRMWSADSVMGGITELVEQYGVTNIRFDDEMFVLNESHVIGLCDRIRGRYDDSLNLWCYGRVDQTKEKFLAKMRQAGFKWLALGIESLSTEVRDGVDKGSYDEVDIIDTVELIKNHGINIIANYMFGLPGDTLASMRQTLNLALELKTEYVNMYAAVAFPGSRLWAEKVTAGWKYPENWLAWSFHSYEHVPLGTDTLSPAEVLRFRDEAFENYFTDSNYLAYITSRFGRRAVDEVMVMLSHKLERKLLG